jgi:hypothetical protein
MITSQGQQQSNENQRKQLCSSTKTLWLPTVSTHNFFLTVINFGTWTKKNECGKVMGL